jgi:L-ribulose-5-phosphate 3-epimerase
MNHSAQLAVGIYEKALPAGLPWQELLPAVRRLGYDYVELSIDESADRLQRLDWSGDERERLRSLARKAGVRILTMCLSGHRKFPMGSADPDVRARAMQIMRQSVYLAVDLGIGIVQVAGYDAYYEPSTDASRARFLDGLVQAAGWAASAGVMLGLENVDTPFVDSVAKGMALVHQVGSPWLQLMPDMGNLAAAGYHPPDELHLGRGHVVAVHVKDTLPNLYRGVPFGHGIVPFAETFAALAGIGFCGPLTVEMWSQMNLSGDPAAAAVAARQFVDGLIATAWAKP